MAKHSKERTQAEAQFKRTQKAQRATEESQAMSEYVAAGHAVSPGSFSFKAALKVQRKESNGVAGLAAAGSSLDREKLRQLVPSLRCSSMTNVRARTPAKVAA
jgi:hypothetical protein